MTWEELPIRGFYSQSIEFFKGDNFLQKNNQGPKGAVNMGFSLGHSLSRDLHTFAHIDLEFGITADPISANRHFKGILLQDNAAHHKARRLDKYCNFRWKRHPFAWVSIT